ncbi:hypothetical protein [Phascolarctobacterium sp.]
MVKNLYACKYAPAFGYDDPLSIIGRIFWQWSEPDRYGILNEYSPYNFKTMERPLPTGMEKGLDFREICLKVAREIIAKAGNKRICVLWSGGVDSTAIVCSLLLAGVDPQQLILAHTHASVREYPYFFLVMKEKLKIKSLQYSWTLSLEQYAQLGSNVLFVTGWCADQLFGSNVNQRYPELYQVDWQTGLKKMIKDRDIKGVVTDRQIDENLYRFGVYADKIGLPIRYTCEALWLFNFAIKWSHVSMDLKLTLIDPVQKENAINFYEDMDFQEWSIEHYQEFYLHNQSTDVVNYKRPLKELIYEYTKDKTYLENKGKVNSWCSAVARIQYSPFCILDDDGYHHLDLMADTEISRKYTSTIDKQEANRRYYMLDYLKEGVDIERFLVVEERQ